MNEIKSIEKALNEIAGADLIQEKGEAKMIQIIILSAYSFLKAT